MKVSQHNKLKMAQASLGCLQHEDNAPLWAGIGGIEEGVASLEATVQAILDRSEKQSARNGLAAQKKGARKALVGAAFTVCSGLKAYASAGEDKKLFAQSDYSRTALARGREADMVNRCQSLLKLGNENADALAAKYNVSANDVKALKNGIAAFGEVQSKPRQGRAASAAATKELEKLFAEMDKTLNEQLDPLLAKFESTNADFHSEYQTARAIVDSAASHDAAAKTMQLPLALPKAA